MSGGLACINKDHKPFWRVSVYKANYSTFNGRHRTRSDYSEIVCLKCGLVWRTKARYVEYLPMLQKQER